MLKGKLGVPDLRVNRLVNRSISCTMKNPKVEVFGYPPSTQAGVAPFNILVGFLSSLVPWGLAVGLHLGMDRASDSESSTSQQAGRSHSLPLAVCAASNARVGRIGCSKSVRV